MQVPDQSGSTRVPGNCGGSWQDPALRKPEKIDGLPCLALYSEDFECHGTVSLQDNGLQNYAKVIKLTHLNMQAYFKNIYIILLLYNNKSHCYFYS